jgi:organic radical activating enzyme
MKTMNRMEYLRRTVEQDRIRLEAIGSPRRPEQLQGQPRLSQLNRSILLNLKEDGHGCRFACSFCRWRSDSLTQTWKAPSNDEIDQFLKSYAGYRVYLSGGGDPLYRYDAFGREWEEINRIIKHLHRRGYLIHVITKEHDTAELLADRVAQFSFSTSANRAEDLRVEIAARKVRRHNASVRVSTVWDDTRPSEYYLESYARLKDVVDEYYLREDLNKYNFSTAGEKYAELFSLMQEHCPKAVIFPGQVCLESYYLIGSDTYRGFELADAAAVGA